MNSTCNSMNFTHVPRHIINVATLPCLVKVKTPKM